VVSEEARPALAAATSAADSYRTMIDLCSREFGRIVTAVARAPAGTVALHCHAGKDRTGIVVALLLRLAGVGDPAIAEDYVLSDLGLQQVYREWIAEAGDPQERARRAREAVSRPESILSTLAHVDARHGGVERYLLDAGVEPADLARLRERLRA
jgi:protein-tyrosine phosphatase